MMRRRQLLSMAGALALLLQRAASPGARRLAGMLILLVGMIGMDSKKYLRYNIIGGLLWGGVLLLLGYGLGTIPAVRENLEIWVIGFVVVSSLPFPIEILRDYLKRRKEKKSN